MWRNLQNLSETSKSQRLISYSWYISSMGHCGLCVTPHSALNARELPLWEAVSHYGRGKVKAGKSYTGSPKLLPRSSTHPISLAKASNTSMFNSKCSGKCYPNISSEGGKPGIFNEQHRWLPPCWSPNIQSLSLPHVKHTHAVPIIKSPGPFDHSSKLNVQGLWVMVHSTLSDRCRQESSRAETN